MNAASLEPTSGIIYTFYSFKGGVGRTMALANVAALLAKWGHSVLVVDWDLEAPGVERFFCRDAEAAAQVRSSKPGVLDLLIAWKMNAPIDTAECVHTIPLNGSSFPVSVITSGKDHGEYADNLHAIDFNDLFDQHGLGAYLEELRKQWKAQFNFILIDSRTGVTDIGGICTVHLADILVLFFTATDSSTTGAKDIIERARKAQSKLPVDRARLLAVPIPSRDESRTEYERAAEWKKKYAEQFGALYSDWLPSGIKPIDAVETLRIPYVPYWSFGERLPVIEEGTAGPGSLGYSYQILGRLLAARLDWYKALDGESLAPPPSNVLHKIDVGWLEKHRGRARHGLKKTGTRSFLEVSHSCTNVDLKAKVWELPEFARQAIVRTSGWPIGLVLDNEDKPIPEAGGIYVEISAPDFDSEISYDYWALATSGDFYALASFRGGNQSIFSDEVIRRTAEALLHSANLYKAFGAEPNAEVEIHIGYWELRGRTLKRSSSISSLSQPSWINKVNRSEDFYLAQVRSRLSLIESRLVDMTISVCEGLFALFDFERFPKEVYSKTVSNFVDGKTA